MLWRFLMLSSPLIVLFDMPVDENARSPEFPRTRLRNPKSLPKRYTSRRPMAMNSKKLVDEESKASLQSGWL